MNPTATTQLTAMELVMGKPNGLAISTGFCVGPCSGSSCASVSGLACALGADVAEAMPDSALTAKAQSAPRHINTAAESSDISLVFKLGKTSAPLFGPE